MAKFLTIPQAAERLGVSPNTVRRWIKSGRLPATQPGRAYRIRPQDVRALLKGTL